MDAIAKKLKLKLFRTSVKENFNIDQGMINNRDIIILFLACINIIVFEYLTSKYLNRRAKEITRAKDKMNIVSVGQSLPQNYMDSIHYLNRC